ncbi:MAG: iron ABC transporter permease [Opitutales bacterium]|jgi:iron complex transport system permease protein|nr:iron ABC transporter permease [Opitutales bacterium]MDP4644087.1 iron ABC transporter permease [Opitutales bacterium]MDP4778412.1 iron ABC transporter permease [Opitutales bacterium]MDP4883337.1 iron ABC transporter permease [Opitutales bacterium]MDP5080066.1 iron ABC transporter permease [Opitutales bacterium]
MSPSSADRSSTRHRILFGLLPLAIIALAITSACFGSVSLSPISVIKAITGASDLNPVHQQIILDFRLPRILTSMLAGAALATAGLMMQTVFRNPLADPFVLGVNSGASLGVALVLLALAPAGMSLIDGLSTSGQLIIVLASTGGAAATLFLVLILSRRVDIMSVLIIGLMISYTVGALVSILMFFSMAERLQSFLNWSFGDYGNVSWSQMQIFGPAIFLGLFVSVLFVKPLDALLLGERYAESVGTQTRKVRFFVLLGASLLAGTVTGFCGPIGFLGIAAPHLSRHLFQTSRHSVLIPASICIGALLSLASDFVARGPGLDFVLPLNAITALVGAPVIIAALIKQRNLKRLF